MEEKFTLIEDSSIGPPIASFTVGNTADNVAFSFYGNSSWDPFLTLRADGTIEYKGTPDEAAAAFLNALELAFPSWIARMRHEGSP